MSAAGNKTEVGKALEPDAKKWGDFEGRSGTPAEGNWYDEVFEQVGEELEEGSDYMMFENIELPKEQVIEKYSEELKPDEDEYLEAELETYQTDEGQFKVMNLEKGKIEGIQVASEGKSHRPVVTTDEFPSEGERLASVMKGPSDRYQIIWEE